MYIDGEEITPSDWEIENDVLKGPKPGKENRFTCVGIPPFIATIAGGCFKYCSNLIGVDIPDSVKCIGKEAFYGLENFTDVTIPGSVERIYPYAFAYCRNLRYVTIKDGVKTIDYGVFKSCPIKEIAIPASVTSLDPTFLESTCPNVEITVDEGNKTYKVIDGNLYSYDGKTFVRCFSYNQSWGVKIPDGVTKIGCEAFENCGNLMNVDIPNSVVEIGSRAFVECKNLKSVSLPAGVASIGSNTFCNCEKLRSIVFEDPSNWAFCKYDNGKSKPIKEKILHDSAKICDFLVSFEGKWAWGSLTKLTGGKG